MREIIFISITVFKWFNASVLYFFIINDRRVVATLLFLAQIFPIAFRLMLFMSFYIFPRRDVCAFKIVVP